MRRSMLRSGSELQTTLFWARLSPSSNVFGSEAFYCGTRLSQVVRDSSRDHWNEAVHSLWVQQFRVLMSSVQCRRSHEKSLRRLRSKRREETRRDVKRREETRRGEKRREEIEGEEERRRRDRGRKREEVSLRRRKEGEKETR